MLRLFSLVVCLAECLMLIQASSAGALRFSDSRDSLGTFFPQQNPRGSVLGTQATLETWVLFTAEDAAFGDLYNEWSLALEDKHLRIGPNRVEGFLFGASPASDLRANVNLPLNRWHHIAYVYNGSQEAVYVNGSREVVRSASGDIRDYPRTFDNPPAFNEGYGGFGSYRRGPLTSSFEGVIDSFRISTVARYSGESFLPGMPGDFQFDGSTSSLFNFNEPTSSSLVSGQGSGAFTGQVGGAFSPDLIDTPVGVPEPVSYLLALSVLALVNIPPSKR